MAQKNGAPIWQDRAPFACPKTQRIRRLVTSRPQFGESKDTEFFHSIKKLSVFSLPMHTYPPRAAAKGRLRQSEAVRGRLLHGGFPSSRHCSRVSITRTYPVPPAWRSMYTSARKNETKNQINDIHGRIVGYGYAYVSVPRSGHLGDRAS